MIVCISTIILGKLWNKYGQKLFKYYPFYLLMESLLYGLIVGLIINNILSYKMYYLVDTISFAIITKSIIFGGNKLKAIRYNEGENRNRFDNNMIMASNIASLIGLSLNILLNLSVNVSFIFIFIGVSIDNIFYYLAYKELKIIK